MGFDFLLPFDRAVSQFVLSLRSTVADSVMTVVTLAGDAGAVWIALAIGMICFKQTRTTGLRRLSGRGALSLSVGVFVPVGTFDFIVRGGRRFVFPENGRTVVRRYFGGFDRVFQSVFERPLLHGRFDRGFAGRRRGVPDRSFV